MNFSTLDQIIQSILPHFIQNPFICPGCQEHTASGICETCIRSLRKNLTIQVPQEHGIRGIFPLFVSLTTTHHLLTHWKDYGGSLLQKMLFQITPELKTELMDHDFDVIIPIPQNEERSLKRGHASAFEVAKYFSRELKVPLSMHSLSLKPGLQIKQANLTEWERRHAPNPFQSTEFSEFPLSMMKMKKVLIVDDFITTGSTLEKAANAILEKNPGLHIYAASLGWRPKFTKSLTKSIK